MGDYGALTATVGRKVGDRLDRALVRSPESRADLPVLANTDILERPMHWFGQLIHCGCEYDCGRA